MNIHGADAPHSKRITTRTNNPSTESSHNKSSGKASQAADKAAFFVEKGIEIPREELSALQTGLSRIGLKFSELGNDSILRALILLRNNIPLDVALITVNSAAESSVYGQLSELTTAAKALLSGDSLPPEMRAAIENFLIGVERLSVEGGKPTGALLTENAGNPVFTNAAESIGASPELREMILKSGMALEWRLLAWHRSGGNPQALRNLLGDDLKGLLLTLLDNIKKRSGKGKLPQNLSDIEHKSDSLIDSLTRRQLAAVLSNRGGFGDAQFDLPFGGLSENERAELRLPNRKQKKSDKSQSEKSTLSLNVETSNLGAVSVSMSRDDDAVDVRFSFDDGSCCDLAESMRGELADSLSARGISLRSVLFGLHSTLSQTTKGDDKPLSGGSVDMTG